MGDLDILIRSTPEKARLLGDILKQFGSAHSVFTESDFLKPGSLFSRDVSRLVPICSPA
jgi:hypothetical protein